MRKHVYQVIENGYNEMTRLEQKAAYKYNELLMSKLFKKRTHTQQDTVRFCCGREASNTRLKH